MSPAQRQQIKFTALVTKQLKSEFDHAFTQFKQSRGQVTDCDPDIQKQRAAILVHKFFENVHSAVKALHGEVSAKIKNSQSLRELEQLLEENRELFPQQQTTQSGQTACAQDRFQMEKLKFDEKVAKGRFAYVVKRSAFYEQLMSSIDTNSARMRQTVEKSKE